MNRANAFCLLSSVPGNSPRVDCSTPVICAAQSGLCYSLEEYFEKAKFVNSSVLTRSEPGNVQVTFYQG